MDRSSVWALEDLGRGEEEAYSGRIIDLRTIKEALGRYRLFWATCAALGLVIGAAFHLVIPAKYTAVTILYMAEPASGGTYTVADDVNLLETAKVAQTALHRLRIAGTKGLPGGYTGLALSNTLLEIKADASTPARAVHWAKAVSEAFMSVRAQTLGGQTKLVVASLESQAKQLAADVQRLNDTISVLSGSSSSKAAALVAEMVSERGTDESQLTSLQNQAQQDLLEQSAVDKGTYVLDPPSAQLVHTKRMFVKDGLAGLVGGLAIGMGGIILGAIISDRPRRRAAVAALLGAPVELSVRGVVEPAWHTVARRYAKKPGPQLELAQRRILEKLTQLRRPALAVVSVGKNSTATAAAILAGAALSLAAEHKHVVLVDMAKGRPLGLIFRVRRRGVSVGTVALDGNQVRLAVAPDDVRQLDSEEVVKGADAVLVLANADPAVGSEQLSGWAEGAVLLLRAGQASDVLIQSSGQMLRDAGVVPLSAILLDADKGDDTFGSVTAAPTTFDLSTNGGTHGNSPSQAAAPLFPR
jgi:hypothetical protein